jgi:hypothetical protein
VQRTHKKKIIFFFYKKKKQMKDNQLLSILFVLLIMIIFAISFAIAGFNKTNDVLTTEEQTSLKELLNNTYITSTGCLDAKCFTDNFVNPHSETVFFSASEGIVTCQSVNTQEIDVGDTLVITPLTLSMSNILKLSSTGIVSSNLFQIEASMSVSETFQVGGFTTTERLALVPQDGTIVYDSTVGVLSVYQSGAWFLVSGVSGVVSISSNTLAITGTNTDPIIDLMPSGIVAGTYQAPTITFNTYGIATSAVSSTVVLGISSSTLTIGGTSSNPTVNLTPSGIAANSYSLATVTFNTYGIATSAIQNTLSGTANQINVSSFPNSIISLNAGFVTTVNGKVDRSGDTMTGRLNSSFVGIASSPNFAINATNGIFQSNMNYLSFATNSLNRMEITSAGDVAILNLSTGVVHSDSNGLLTSSLVTNSEIKTQTPLNTANYIVTRDASGNFAANMIKLTVGATLQPNDVATKDYVDTAINLGLSVKQPVVAVSVDSHISDPPTGSQTIDSVIVTTGDRVLLIAQGNPINNGAWVVQVGVWTRPTDFNTGDSAGAAYFLVQMGTIYTGSSWVCSTPMAVIGTDSLVFAQFSSPQSAMGHNDAPTDGLVYNNSVGSTLHFRSLLNDVNGYLTMTNLTNSVQFAINATSANTPNAIVARDASRNFSANVITASSVVGANLVTNTTNISIPGHLVSYSDSSGKVIVDSGVVASTLSGGPFLPLSGGTMSAPFTTVSGSASSPGLLIGGSTCGLSFVSGAFQISLLNSLVFSLGSTLGAGVLKSTSGSIVTSSLIVTADITAGNITTTLLANGAVTDAKITGPLTTAGLVANTATTATSALGINTIVLRDGSNNFSAATITANLTGNATTATTASNFSGSLAGDVTGTQSATVVSFVGGVTSTNIATGVNLANAATNSNLGSTIVKRDGSGNFSAGVITATSIVAGNVVTNTTNLSTPGHLVSYSDSSGKVIVDSGIVASSLTGGPFLKLDGTSSMTGDLNIGTHNINNITDINMTGNINGAASSTFVDQIVSNPGVGPSGNLVMFGGFPTSIIDSTRPAANILVNNISGSFTSGNLAVFIGTTGRVIHDTGIASSSITGGPFLALSGGAMTGDIDMGSHDITNINELIFNSNLFPAIPPLNSITVYLSGNHLRYRNNAGTSFQVATLTDLSSYLLLAGGTMTGDINLNSHNITNFATLQPVNGVNIGTGLTLSTDPDTNTIVGNGAFSTTGFGLNTCFGYQSGCLTPGTGSNCAFGALATASGNSGATAIGAGSLASGQDSVVLARGGQATALRAVLIGGNGALNNVANSVMFGDTGIVNVRANSTTCDLGTAALPFQTLYLNTGIDSAGALNVGTVNSTSINIGKVGVITKITGLPPFLGKLASTASLALTGVLTAQSLIPTSIGNLVYAANSTYAGTTIAYRIWGLITNTSPNSATIVININGSSAVSLIWLPGTVTNAVFQIKGVLSVQTTNAVIDIQADVNPVGTTTFSVMRNASLPTWDKTIINTLSATLQFSNGTSGGTVFHAMFSDGFD